MKARILYLTEEFSVGKGTWAQTLGPAYALQGLPRGGLGHCWIFAEISRWDGPLCNDFHTLSRGFGAHPTPKLTSVASKAENQATNGEEWQGILPGLGTKCCQNDSDRSAGERYILKKSEQLATFPPNPWWETDTNRKHLRAKNYLIKKLLLQRSKKIILLMIFIEELYVWFSVSA